MNLNPLSWILPPWAKWVALGIVIAALFTGGMWLGSTLKQGEWDAAKVRADAAANKQLADEVAKRIQLQADDTVAAEHAAKDLEAMRAARDALASFIAGQSHSAYVKTIEEPSHGPTCPVYSLSAPFRVCFNAAVSGDPAAAAACEASGVLGSGGNAVVSAPGDVRPGGPR